MTKAGEYTISQRVATLLPIVVKGLGSITEPLAQVFAWNPSAVGVKSEDTFLLLPSGQKEIVTATPNFPQVDLNRVLGRSTAVTKSGIVGC